MGNEAIVQGVAAGSTSSGAKGNQNQDLRYSWGKNATTAAIAQYAPVYGVQSTAADGISFTSAQTATSLGMLRGIAGEAIVGSGFTDKLITRGITSVLYSAATSANIINGIVGAPLTGSTAGSYLTASSSATTAAQFAHLGILMESSSGTTTVTGAAKLCWVNID